MQVSALRQVKSVGEFPKGVFRPLEVGTAPCWFQFDTRVGSPEVVDLSADGLLEQGRGEPVHAGLPLVVPLIPARRPAPNTVANAAPHGSRGKSGRQKECRPAPRAVHGQ